MLETFLVEIYPFKKSNSDIHLTYPIIRLHVPNGGLLIPS